MYPNFSLFFFFLQFSEETITFVCPQMFFFLPQIITLPVTDSICCIMQATVEVLKYKKTVVPAWVWKLLFLPIWWSTGEGPVWSAANFKQGNKYMYINKQENN